MPPDDQQFRRAFAALDATMERDYRPTPFEVAHPLPDGWRSVPLSEEHQRHEWQRSHPSKVTSSLTTTRLITEMLERHADAVLSASLAEITDDADGLLRHHHAHETLRDLMQPELRCPICKLSLEDLPDLHVLTPAERGARA